MIIMVFTLSKQALLINLKGLSSGFHYLNCFGRADLKDRKSASVLTILAGVLWGTSFPTIKIGLEFVNPYVFVFLRMSIASALALMIIYATKNFAASLAKKRLIWYLGLLNGAVCLIQYIGMRYTTASKSSLLVNLSVVWFTVLSWLIPKERFSRKKLAETA